MVATSPHEVIGTINGYPIREVRVVLEEDAALLVSAKNHFELSPKVIDGLYRFGQVLHLE